MDCSDCDASGLDSPNSSWSIARLKEYLRRKKRPSKRGKKPSFLNVIISTDFVTSTPWTCPSFFFNFFICSSFFLFLFLFSSSPACCAPLWAILLIYRNTAQQVSLYFFCNPVWMHTACWPTSRVGRSIGGSFTNFTSLALQPLVFRQLWIKSDFIIWPTGVNCTLSLRVAGAFLCFVVHADPLETGARRLQVAGEKKNPMALHLVSGSD